MEKVAEQHILTKCSKCNTFQVIGDLVHDFMNFNALKIILKIQKKIIKLEDRSQKKKIMFLHSKNKASRKGYKGEC